MKDATDSTVVSSLTTSIVPPSAAEEAIGAVQWETRGILGRLLRFSPDQGEARASRAEMRAEGAGRPESVKPANMRPIPTSWPT